MKIITTQPCLIAVRPAPAGWEIVCPPGALAQLLNQLAHRETTAIEVERIGSRAMAVIPLTDELDQSLAILVDTFITLRYETGQVQLTLFAAEEV